MLHKNILIVEDSASQAKIYQEYLTLEPYDVAVVFNGIDALKAIELHTPDVILLDLKLPDINGLDILKHIKEHKVKASVIVVSSETSVNVAVKAMQFGANDFVAKPVHPERLKTCVATAIEDQQLHKIETTYAEDARVTFCDFIGGSSKMQTVYHIIENAAHSKASVLITGESGTGKELAANAIHQLSGRSEQHLEVLNCAAIPHALLESEMFGHMKGAFTGAIAQHEGAAKRADGGTFFLDELAEMSLDLQSKLLRFIQTGTFTPIGGTFIEKVDVRFVSATNKVPLQAVKEGLLRDDLYYRLNVIPIIMPPLRERGDDIYMLAQHFLEQVSCAEGRDFEVLAPETREFLFSYDWPGNVRELQNVIHNAVVMNSGKVLTIDMLPEYLSHQPDTDLLRGHENDINLTANLEGTESGHYHKPDKPEQILPLHDLEREIIEAAVDMCHGNISEAARRLKINASTIHRKYKIWHKQPHPPAYYL